MRLFRLVNPTLPTVAASPEPLPKAAMRRGWTVPSGAPTVDRKRAGERAALPSASLAPASAAPIVPSEVSPDAWKADLVLRCGGVSLAVHRFVLAARAEVFAAMLKPMWRESAENEARPASIRWRRHARARGR